MSTPHLVAQKNNHLIMLPDSVGTARTAYVHPETSGASVWKNQGCLVVTQWWWAGAVRIQGHSHG